MVKKERLIGVVTRCWEARCTQNNSLTPDLFHPASLPDASGTRGGTTLSLVTQMWLERTKSLLRWLVVIATAVVVLRVGLNYTSDLKNIDLEFEIFWLISALIATTAANLLLPLGWRQMILSFDQALSAGPAVRLWCLAQTARYLPTGLLAIASRSVSYTHLTLPTKA